VIGAAEIQRSLAGAWKLFLGRPEDMRDLDTSVAGFWRSFQAIVLVAPVYAVASQADWAALAAAYPDGALDPSAFWFLKATTLALDWVTLPLILALVGGFLGIRDRYAAFIVARNWSTVIAVLPFGLTSALALLGLLPGEAIIIPSLVALGFALRMSYAIARIALAAPVEVAIGYVVLDFLISLAIVRLLARLSGIEVG
jgi:hypothetical protein